MPTDQENALIQAFAQMQIIDCHEHLPPEQTYLRHTKDACALLWQYVITDLATAGMSQEDVAQLSDNDAVGYAWGRVPLERRWGLLKPHLENVRFGSYARPGFIVARELYGYDEINDDTYVPLSEAMRAQHSPGIYGRILGEKCGISLALTQHRTTEYQNDPLMAPLMPITWSDVTTWDEVQQQARVAGATVSSLDDYLGAMEGLIVQWKAEGTVGLKTNSSPTVGDPDRAAARQQFEALRGGSERHLPTYNALRDYLRDEAYKSAARHDLTVAVHAGVWGDFRDLDSGHIIPAIMRHPQTRFDLYHMGIPAVRQTGVIGKNFPNVWLNLCWSHIVSPAMTRSALDEYLDMVPVNKILGFGGDYFLPVENVYGHLVMARENIAEVLSRRIGAGLMTESQALGVARKWFWDNPIACYRLQL
jgi:uncharacterized protein